MTGYRIFVSQGLASYTFDIEEGDTSNYIVNDLLIDTEYGFRISALTITGPLPYSELVTASTNNETSKKKKKLWGVKPYNLRVFPSEFSV